MWFETGCATKAGSRAAALPTAAIAASALPAATTAASTLPAAATAATSTLPAAAGSPPAATSSLHTNNAQRSNHAAQHPDRTAAMLNAPTPTPTAATATAAQTIQALVWAFSALGHTGA